MFFLVHGDGSDATMWTVLIDGQRELWIAE